MKKGTKQRYNKKYACELLDFYRTYATWDSGRAKRAELASLVAFSRYSGIALGTLLQWLDEHADFARAFELCREYSLQYIIDGVFNGAIPPPAAKLLVELEGERYAQKREREAFELKISYPNEERSERDERNDD